MIGTQDTERGCRVEESVLAMSEATDDQDPAARPRLWAGRRRTRAMSMLAVLASVSIVVCASATFAWVRSYQTQFILMHLSNPHENSIGTAYGRLWVILQHDAPDGWHYDNQRGLYFYTPPVDHFYFPPWNWRRLGFDTSSEVGFDGFHEQGVAIPLWSIVCLTLIAPGFWCRRHLQRRSRIRRGLCLVCGYDLRGMTDRCPECGAACKAASAAGESPAPGD